MALKSVKPILNSGDSKTPWIVTILSRVMARYGTETFQCKTEPDILSQVNRTCPPGQTDTIPNGDSDMVVPIHNNIISSLTLRSLPWKHVGSQLLFIIAHLQIHSSAILLSGVLVLIQLGTFLHISMAHHSKLGYSLTRTDVTLASIRSSTGILDV